MEQQSTSEHAHAQASDMEIEAAMLAEAAALVDDASSATGDASAVPAETPADGAGAAVGDDDDSDVDAGDDASDDSEEYDAAVDDTDEGDEIDDAVNADFNTDVDRDVVGTDDVELPRETSEADLLAAMAPDSAPLAPHPPAPGSPESSFRKCDCLGTMPGRACLRCGGSRWTKQCTQAGCGGRGTLSTPNRNASGPPRVERCGFCMGRGLVPARGAEVNEAQNLHTEAVAAATRRKAQQAFSGVPVAPATAPKEIQRRKPVLPSAGKPKQKPKSKPGAKRK